MLTATDFTVRSLFRSAACVELRGFLIGENAGAAMPVLLGVQGLFEQKRFVRAGTLRNEKCRNSDPVAGP